MAAKTNRSVHWRALAIDGGDVSELHNELLPKLADAIEELEADNNDWGKRKHRIDAVVLMCGLNDWKRSPMQPGTQNPSSFQRDLIQLCETIHEMVGRHVPIVLPGLPLHWCLGFPQPLRSILVSVSNVWDARKALLADQKSYIDFVPVPRFLIPSDEVKNLLAVDGVHPNENGYRIWGDLIAEAILKRFQSKESSGGTAANVLKRDGGPDRPGVARHSRL